jgi:hypothetical protein
VHAPGAKGAIATPVEDGACAIMALGVLASHPMLAAPAAHQAMTFSIRVFFLKIIGFLLRLASAARARDPDVRRRRRSRRNGLSGDPAVTRLAAPSVRDTQCTRKGFREKRLYIVSIHVEVAFTHGWRPRSYK